MFRGGKDAAVRSCQSIFHKIEQIPVAYGRHVEFNKTDRTDKLNRYLTKTEILVTIDTKDKDPVDMIAPFICGLSDLGCTLNSS